MRINARFDEATEKQLEYLTQTTGQTVSHVVRESVAQYYVQVKSQRQPSRLVALGVAGQWRSGSTDTPESTSTVRSGVLQALQAKYPQHFGLERAPAVAAPEPGGARAKPGPKRRTA